MLARVQQRELLDTGGKIVSAVTMENKQGSSN